MPLRDLIRSRRTVPARREEMHPFLSLQREINRLMEDFFGEIEPAGISDPWFRTFSPRVDVKETEKEIKVSAELPGLDEKDIEVLMSNDTLTIKGEKKEEKEEKEESYHRMERRFGSFSRVIPLPEGIDTEKVQANFEKGILRISLPKTEKAAGAKKIPVKT